MTRSREARAPGVSPRWWAALLGAVAAWEIFLRVDSRVLAPSTKLWFFPLLVAAFALVGGALVRVVGIVGGAVLGGGRAAALARPVFAVVAGALAGAEYAFLTFHHPVAPVRLAPVVATVVAVLAWTATRGSGAARGATTDRARRSTGGLVVAAAAVGIAFAAACARPDVGTALIKRNTALGRLLGHSLALVPRHVAAAGPVARPPDLTTARPLGRANVILLSIDALRQDALGTYGGGADASPRLDAFAAASVVFEDAYAQVPSSAPSIATLLTGTYPARHGVRENRMALDFSATTVAETLAGAGYATAAFVTNPNFAPGFHLDQGFATFHLIPSTERENGLLLDASDEWAVDAALAWAKAAPSRPVLLWVHVMAPHAPYVPPPDLRPVLDPSGPWFDVWNMGGDARVAPGRSYFDLGVYRSLYAAEVRSADRLAARLFDGLGALGLLDDAHVLVFADHGEAFGENDVFAHGRSLDPAETRVPLIWRLPRGRRGGARITTTAQLADVTPTVLRLLDVAVPAPVDGRDLSGALLGEAPDDEGFAYTQARFLHSMGVKGLLYGVRTRTRTLWIDAGYGYDGEYDRRADPGEERMRRYAGRGDDPLRRTLETMAHAGQESLRRPPLRGAVDPQQIEQLRALGYVQ